MSFSKTKIPGPSFDIVECPTYLDQPGHGPGPELNNKKTSRADSKFVNDMTVKLIGQANVSKSNVQKKQYVQKKGSMVFKSRPVKKF